MQAALFAPCNGSPVVPQKWWPVIRIWPEWTIFWLLDSRSHTRMRTLTHAHTTAMNQLGIQCLAQKCYGSDDGLNRCNPRQPPRQVELCGIEGLGGTLQSEIIAQMCDSFQVGSQCWFLIFNFALILSAQNINHSLQLWARRHSFIDLLLLPCDWPAFFTSQLP